MKQYDYMIMSIRNVHTCEIGKVEWHNGLGYKLKRESTSCFLQYVAPTKTTILYQREMGGPSSAGFVYLVVFVIIVITKTPHGR